VGVPSLFVVPAVVLFYAVVGILAAAAFGNQWARARLSEVAAVALDRPWFTAGGVVLAFVIAWLVWLSQKWIRDLPDDTRRTVLGFWAVGFILLAVLGIVFLVDAHRLFAEQMALFLVASLLPGALYYLFLRTRRPSILNEFTMNLWRLGLLVPRHTYLRLGAAVVTRNESREDLVARVDSYFQKFEAVYGALRFETPGGAQALSRTSFVEAILPNAVREADRRQLVQPTVRLADILTANIFIPLGFATFLSALGWLLVLEPRWVAVAPPPPPEATGGVLAAVVRRLNPIATPLNFAFLGAYFFGLQALFRRFVRRDLGPNAFLSFSNRIVLSVIGTWVLVVCYALGANATIPELLAPSPPSTKYGLLVTAFVIGVFPRTLWQVITAALTKVTFVKLAVPSVEAKQPLDDLDGLTIWHESRLEEEDIENVPNMATADVVDLVLHTQIPADRLVDWVDQAILLKTLGPELETDLSRTRRGRLRIRGIRTATQLVRDHFDADAAERTKLAGCLGDGQDTSVAEAIVRAIQIEANWEQVAAWRNVERPAVDAAAWKRAHEPTHAAVATA
jgi:hypothetical protein